MFNTMAKEDSEAMQILRNRVRRIIEARNLTIKDVAVSSGVTREYLSRMLAGRQDCSLINAEKLAKALGISMSELFAAEEFDKKTA